MAIKSNALFGAADKLIDFITTNSADLTAKNITPAPLNTALGTAKTAALTAETTQEAAKETLKNTTIAAKSTQQSLYDLLTSVIDACAGALGKKSAKGKQCLAIRKQLGGRGGGGGGTSSGH